MAGFPRLRHTKPTSPEAPFYRTIDNFVGAGIVFPLFAYLPVPVSAQAIYFGQHSLQQFFRGLGWDTCLLQILNLSPLPQHLAAHVLYFGANC
jgi:hypothetical protein